MKLVDVKSSRYIDSNKENDKGDSKFKVGDYVRISKYKNIFAWFKLEWRSFCN